MLETCRCLRGQLWETKYVRKIWGPGGYPELQKNTDENPFYGKEWLQTAGILQDKLLQQDETGSLETVPPGKKGTFSPSLTRGVRRAKRKSSFLLPKSRRDCNNTAEPPTPRARPSQNYWV